MPPSAVDMSGQVCVITGANSGIGLETAKGLARHDATIVMACRDTGRGEEARALVVDETGNKDVRVMQVDLASLASVGAFAAAVRDAHPRIHVLVNNAGIYAGRRVVTVDGHESTFAVNHLAHFLLTGLLLETLKASPPARVVNVASEAHRGARLDLNDLDADRKWSAARAYANSKLANILFTYELARRLDGTRVTANAAHPGSVRTNWARHETGFLPLIVRAVTPFLISPEKGARTPIYLASSPDVENISGRYFVRSKPARSSRASRDEDAARRLWEISERMTGVGQTPVAAQGS